MIAFRATDEENLNEQIGAMKLLAQTLFREDSIEIQVFRATSGIVYRVLEPGYGLRNLMWKEKRLFPTCNYDNRTDIPKGDEKNEAIADEIDNMIGRHMYYIVSIADKRNPA
jgi:hypothetical protein